MLRRFSRAVWAFNRDLPLDVADVVAELAREVWDLMCAMARAGRRS